MAMVSVPRATWPTESAEWMEIDEQLRANKTKRGGLDAHEMYWLREAERVEMVVREALRRCPLPRRC